MTVTFVFFDLYGTLAQFDPPREVIQQNAASQFGLQVTREGIDTGYHLADQLLSAQNARKPVRSMSQPQRNAFFARFEQLILHGAGHEVDLELAGKIWERVTAQEYGLALFDDVIEVLDALKAKDVRSAVITNFPQPGHAVEKSMGLAGHVEFTVTSGEVGHEKPHAPIFEEALRRAGVPVRETVLVGDQVDSDLAGASAVGIRPILMDRYNNYPGYSDHPRVTSMGELPALLASM